jgi:YjbE family integral membrane protein
MDVSGIMHQICTVNFLCGLMSIMLINVILSGDNAVVIAMAVRSLSPNQRRRGILLGTLGAVFLRIGLTFFAARLLEISFLKLLGGLLIGWLAIKLFLEGGVDEDTTKEVTTLRKAVVTILIADLVMSTDNVLAVAGASKGNLLLLIFGLATSIPLVVFASGLLSRLMDRFPIIVYLGAAVLGKVSGEMIISDPVMVKVLHNPGHYVEYGVQILFAIAVVVAGKVCMRIRASRRAAAGQQVVKPNPFYLADWDLL